MFHLPSWVASSYRSARRPVSVRLDVEQFEELRLPAALHLPSMPAVSGHALIRPERHTPPAASGQDLAALLDAAQHGGRYAQPPQCELRQAQPLLLRRLSGQEYVAVLRRAWQRLNFDLISVRSGDQPVVVLRESAGHQTGRGFYAFRLGGAPAVALQAPHSNDDAFTGTIAASLFQEGQIQAGAWNTVRRSS